jgi:hypothetical protein
VVLNFNLKIQTARLEDLYLEAMHEHQKTGAAQ